MPAQRIFPRLSCRPISNSSASIWMASEALGQVFVERTFGPDMKARTLTMTKEIEKAMEDDIKQLPWMSEATRQQALLKLHSVTNKIGYPDKWRDYSSIRIERGDFAGNVYQAAVFEGRRQLAKIGKPVDRGEWGMTPPTVNAYYDPLCPWISMSIPSPRPSRSTICAIFAPSSWTITK